MSEPPIYQLPAIIVEVQDWLADGLKAWGAGAKTAAGYGYFEIVTP